MSVAPGAPLPPTLTVESAIQQIRDGKLSPERAASIMNTDEKARAVLENEEVWKEFARVLNIHIPDDLRNKNQWRLGVESCYRDVNQAALFALGHEVQHLDDIFPQFEQIKLHLEDLGKGQLSFHLINAISIAASQNKLEAIRFLLNMKRPIGEEARKAAIEVMVGLAQEPNEKEAILCLLNAGIPIDSQHFGTALWKAASSGNLSIAKMLIERGADVNAKDPENGVSVLTAAVSSSGNEDLVRILLANGARVNEESDYKATALMYANTPEIARMLIQKGAQVNKKDSDGRTALMLTSSKAVAEVLIANGAKVNERNNNNESVLMVAIKGNETELIEALLSHDATDVNLPDNDGQTPLMLALQKGKDDLAQKLLNRSDIDVNMRDKNGKTALIYAAEMGNRELVIALIEKGADINAEDDEGRTVLMKAAENGHAATVQYLIQRHVNVNEVDHHGQTALIRAVIRDRPNVVRLLANSDATKLNTKDRENHSALYLAHENGFDEIARILEGRGARE